MTLTFWVELVASTTEGEVRSTGSVPFSFEDILDNLHFWAGESWIKEINIRRNDGKA